MEHESLFPYSPIQKCPPMNSSPEADEPRLQSDSMTLRLILMHSSQLHLYIIMQNQLFTTIR
jgi:hypothetical protein